MDDPLPASPDWDVLGGFAESLGRFVPGLPGAGVSTTFRGWPTFTPDGRWLVIALEFGIKKLCRKNVYAHAGERASGPEIEAMNKAISSTVRAIGPTTAKLNQAETLGQALKERSAGLEAKSRLQPAKIGDIDEQERKRAVCAPYRAA